MSHQYLRYVRTGAAQAIGAPEEAAAASRARFRVSVGLTGNGNDLPAAGADLALLGPGDVVGLDPRHITRTVPRAYAVDVEPGAFCAVEFVRPDLPWMFSPHAPRSDTDTLTPWLGLVVVAETALRAATPLPVLTVNSIDDLPPVSQAHAWAHAQISGTDGAEDARLILKDQPARAISRIMAARLLAPRTRYLACVVPLYEAGRLAGLGRAAAGDESIRPAWNAEAAFPLELPVYHSWSFSTGDVMGFEPLVRSLLPPKAALPGVGVRSLDASSPGGGIPDQPAGGIPVILEMDGALAPVGPGKAPPPADLAAAIPGMLDRPNAVSPPRYGRWHAAAPVDPTVAAPRWLSELNNDPTLRVAASLGTAVVQKHQEELMEVAWRQVGEIRRANQLLRQGELAVAVSTRVFQRRFVPLNSAAAGLAGLAFAGPAAARIRLQPGKTMLGAVGESCLPWLAISPAFRKAMRPNGTLGREMRNWQQSDGPPRSGRLVAELAAGRHRDAGPPKPDVGVLDPAGLRDFLVSPDAAGLPPGAADRLANALSTGDLTAGRGTEPDCAPLDAAAVRAVLETRLDPAATIPSRVRAQLSIPDGTWDPADRIDPIIVAPSITTPMVRPLIELGQDWLIPGLDAVPPRTIAILQPNRKFIEAYMVGLNHEMGRELLWRGFPTDQRGTVFGRFWDTEAGSGQAGDAGRDIEYIHLWEAGSELGKHPPPEAPGDLMVVLIRGELVRRFPSATIFLQKAVANGAGGRVPSPVGAVVTKLPLYRGRMDPDILYLGFDLSPEDAKGTNPASEGWYVGIQEQPGELAFGMADAGDDEALADPAGWEGWKDLVWQAMRLTPGGYIDLAATADGFATGASPRPSDLAPDRFVPQWDGRADTLAAITTRRPFRLYIHASEFLP